MRKPEILQQNCAKQWQKNFSDFSLFLAFKETFTLIPNPKTRFRKNPKNTQLKSVNNKPFSRFKRYFLLVHSVAILPSDLKSA